MRIEKDFLGEVNIPADALYGIHSYRAKQNFANPLPFSLEWYKAMGTVKLACYRTVRKLFKAVQKEHPDLLDHLNLPTEKILGAMELAATEVSSGSHFEHFIVPAVQGGAGTSINLNVSEIISNVALLGLGAKPGEYQLIDPIETANIFQSTNDVVPTALTVAVMQLLNELEEAVNGTRSSMEQLEITYRSSLRLAYTQMQEAVPSTYGQLFGAYNEALSRDWWRISKSFERIKVVNLGGGATGTGISLPRFYIMEVVPVLKNLTNQPISQSEHMPDSTSNMDKWVEVHAILKAHAVNMEKIASDLRLLASGLMEERDLKLPDRQVGSSIMPGKVNPVISEFIISSAHRIYANDQLISSLAGQGCLDLNAYLPEIGSAMLESMKLMISMNKSMKNRMLDGIKIDEDNSRSRLYRSPAVTTALSPLIGYHKAAQLAKAMSSEKTNIFEANEKLGLLDQDLLKKTMEPDQLLKKGFTMNDIRNKI